METPIEHVHDDGLRMTMIGENDAHRRVLSDVLAGVTVTVEWVARYRGTALTSPPLLTERQHDIVEVAVSEGSFENPRRITQAEFAATLEISAGTLSEHLRKIERMAFERLYG